MDILDILVGILDLQSCLNLQEITNLLIVNIHLANRLELEIWTSGF